MGEGGADGGERQPLAARQRTDRYRVGRSEAGSVAPGLEASAKAIPRSIASRRRSPIRTSQARVRDLGEFARIGPVGRREEHEVVPAASMLEKRRDPRFAIRARPQEAFRDRSLQPVE